MSMKLYIFQQLDLPTRLHLYWNRGNKYEYVGTSSTSFRKMVRKKEEWEESLQKAQANGEVKEVDFYTALEGCAAHISTMFLAFFEEVGANQGYVMDIKASVKHSRVSYSYQINKIGIGEVILLHHSLWIGKTYASYWEAKEAAVKWIYEAVANPVAEPSEITEFQQIIS